MIIEIDLGSSRPLYQQIADGIRRALVRGDLESGDRLPPGRELAESLGVNLETVQRAYRLLVEDNIVTSRVGRGTRVADAVDLSRLHMERAVDALISQATEVGLGAAELLDLVAERMALES